MKNQNFIDGSPVDPPVFKDKGRHATCKAGVYKPAATQSQIRQEAPKPDVVDQNYPTGGAGSKNTVENVVPPQINQEEIRKPSQAEKELQTRVPKKNKNVGTGQFVVSTWDDQGSKLDQMNKPGEINASINAAAIGVNPPLDSKTENFSKNAPLNAPTNPQQRDIGTEDNRSTHLSLGSQKDELKNEITDAINNDPSRNLPVQKVEQLDTTADFMKFEKQAEELQKQGKTYEETKEAAFEKSGPNQKELVTKASKQQPLNTNYVPDSEKKAPPHERDSGRTLPERIEQAAEEFNHMDQKTKGPQQQGKSAAFQGK